MRARVCAGWAPLLTEARKIVRQILSVLLLTLVVGACGGEEFASESSAADAGPPDAPPPGPTCAQQPSMCPASQTCWITTTRDGWQCMNAGAGAVGDPCELLAGTPTCGPGLICFAVAEGPSPLCTEACSPTDPQAACPGGRQCVGLIVESLRFHACEP